MTSTISRLIRISLVCAAALTTGFGPLPEVICCCNVSFGPGGFLFAAEDPETVSEPAPCCSCCKKRIPDRNVPESSVDCGSPCQCRYELKASPDAVPGAAESSPAALATPSELDLPSSKAQVLDVDSGLTSEDDVDRGRTGPRGCALRQVWLI